MVVVGCGRRGLICRIKSLIIDRNAEYICIHTLSPFTLYFNSVFNCYLFSPLHYFIPCQF
jgi:hypothetical protein